MLWVAINGLGSILALVAMDKLWRFSTGDNPVGAFFNRCLRFTILGHSIFYLSLTSGVDIQKVIGYSSIPSLKSLILQSPVTKEVEKYDIQKRASVVCDCCYRNHCHNLCTSSSTNCDSRGHGSDRRNNEYLSQHLHETIARIWRMTQSSILKCRQFTVTFDSPRGLPTVWSMRL